MIQYIKQYAKVVMDAVQPRNSTAPIKQSPDSSRIVNSETAILHIGKELNRLDPRDFEPSAQAEFGLIGNLGGW
jgi:hypothetical protein